jgi:hypothetical protein
MAKALQIKDFTNYYITDSGEVYSRNYNRTGRIIKLLPSEGRRGYLKVTLSKNNKLYNKSIHRLVAETFIPNPENKPQVNHIDGNIKNNNVMNLEWCSCAENIQHSYSVLHRKPNKTMLGKFGKEHPQSKVIQQIKDGVVIAEFYGSAEAQRKTGIWKSVICNCCNGKALSAGGYQWAYK